MIKELYTNIEEEEVSLGRLDQASTDKLYNVDELFEGNTAGMCIDTSQLAPEQLYMYSGLAKKNKTPVTKPTLTFTLTDNSANFILQITNSQSTYINSWLYASEVANVVKSFKYVFNQTVLTLPKTILTANSGINYLLKIRHFTEKDGQLWEYKKLVPINWNGAIYVLGSITDYI